MTTHDLIRTARQSAGLTQQGLADLLKVPQSRVAEWETRVKCRGDTLLKILEITKYKRLS